MQPVKSQHSPPISSPAISVINRLDSIKSLQENYSSRNNPNAFYCMLDLREVPRIIWSHNAARHIGDTQFGLDSLFNYIHPRWREYFERVGKSILYVIHQSLENQALEGMVFCQNIPFVSPNGKIYWYNQVSIACNVASTGYDYKYMLEFHKVIDFDRLIPSKTRIIKGNKRVDTFSDMLDAKVSEQAGYLLRSVFSPTNLRVLNVYRSFIANGEPTKRSAVASALDMTSFALDKANTRLLEQASIIFPRATLSSVNNLAHFINDYFGKP